MRESSWDDLLKKFPCFSTASPRNLTMADERMKLDFYRHRGVERETILCKREITPIDLSWRWLGHVKHLIMIKKKVNFEFINFQRYSLNWLVPFEIHYHEGYYNNYRGCTHCGRSLCGRKSTTLRLWPTFSQKIIFSAKNVKWPTFFFEEGNILFFQVSLR